MEMIGAPNPKEVRPNGQQKDLHRLRERIRQHRLLLPDHERQEAGQKGCRGPPQGVPLLHSKAAQHVRAESQGVLAMLAARPPGRLRSGG